MAKRQYIDSPCLKKLQKFNRIPMLFIGSGISRRYLQNYPSWSELIQRVATTIGISDSQLLAIQQEITDTNPSEIIGKINAKVASRLTKIFRDKVISGSVSLEHIFSKEEIDYIINQNITFSKMLIAQDLLGYSINTNAKYKSELAELKKLQNHIGAVVTTNYDKFLEKEIFSNFDVFIEQSQYYMTECTGIGEIYKIHGSVESPNTLIFTEEDYLHFQNNLKVIAAKLLNLALEYPIIFIGYSLEDENVLDILHTLVDSLTEKQLETLSENLIYVNWVRNEKFLKESQKSITRDGKTLTLTCINTDNYFVLYKHLQKFVPAEKPERVRKYKKMIHQLIIKSNGGQATIIANDNLDKLNADNKLVVAFSDMETLADIGLTGIGVEEIIKWVLEKNNTITPKIARSIFEKYYLSSRVSASQYVPMFYLAKFCDEFKNEQKLITMKDNLLAWVERINGDSKYPLLKKEELKEKPSSLADYKYIPCIIKAYENGYLSYDEYIELLNNLNSSENYLKDSNFRKAVTYADLKMQK